MASESESLLTCTTDSHWTHYAAFVAYRVAMERIKSTNLGLKILDFAEVSFGEVDLAGDLGSKFDEPITGKTI